MSSVPAALLAFANDWSDQDRHLRALLGEGKAIVKALEPLSTAGLHVLPTIHNATIRDVLDAFRAQRGQIRVFHFGGHASASSLLFEDDAGVPADVHAVGLAGYLGQQDGLVLVFLNGCGTAPQVRRLRDAGVRAVVATTRAIDDATAAEFAEAFYAELAARSLRSAFDAAVHAVQTRWGVDPAAITRDVAPTAESSTPGWPWIIDCDPACEAWSLRAELEQLARRRRRARLLAGAGALLIMLCSLLALSADARRTACRAPGLRSVCVALGVGNVPTAEEQATWKRARGQASGDGLRAYLRTYPTGSYADEARARVAGCSQVRVEKLEREHDIHYILIVNAEPTRLYASELDARADALVRGKRDAERQCAPLASSMQVLSASAQPDEWHCVEDDHRFACGFDGSSVCRVLDRVVANEEHCGDAAADATHGR